MVFLDYGNHQPATPGDWIFAEESAVGPNSQDIEPDVEDEGSGEQQPHIKLTSSAALHELDKLDSLIESKADQDELTMRDKNLSSGSPKIASTAPIPPPPPPKIASTAPAPPPPPPSNGAITRPDRARSRLELAAQLLGVSPPPPPPTKDEANASGETGPYFGIDLTDLYSRDGSAIPPVLVEAANELRKRSEQEGIFRIPGRAQVVSQLVDAADRGVPVELDKQDTADIASFLKKFFALLPSPVIPGDLVDRFGEQRADPKALCFELRQIVDQVLPTERAEVLTFMLSLLHDISLKAEHNKMTSKNLATVFLPALFFSVQSDNTSPEEIMKMAVLGKTVSATLSFMIDNPRLDPDAIEKGAALASKVCLGFACGFIGVTSYSSFCFKGACHDCHFVQPGASEEECPQACAQEGLS